MQHQQQQAAQQQQQLKLQQQQTQQQAGQQAIANSVASQIHQLTQATVPSTKVATNVSLSNVTTTTAAATTVVKARPGGGQIQDVRTTSANVNIQQAAQRTATSLVSAGQTSVGAASGQKGGLVGVTMATAASGNKIPTPAQVQYYRQQQQQQQVLLRQQQLKVLQAQAASGQKVSVAVSATAAAAAAAQRATLMKQGIGSVGTAGAATPQTAVGKPTMTRPMSETEIATALLKRQAMQQQAKAAVAAAAAQGQVSFNKGEKLKKT